MAPAPKRACDIVMKGGITSGIVYPPVIGALADYWSFKNIGGTSAGAIAAAATAAAQFGAQTQGERPFARLAALPEELAETEGAGQPTRLLRLFQPEPETAALYRVVLALLASAWGQALRGALQVTPWAAWLGALPLVIALGLLLAALGARQTGAGVCWAAALVALGWTAWEFYRLRRAGWFDAQLAACGGLLLLLLGAGVTTGWTLFGYALTLALVLGVSALLAALLLGFVWQVWRVLPDKFYGFCSGQTVTDAGQAPLTIWLADLIDELAGRPVDGPPLTFGALWLGREPQSGEDAAAVPVAARFVNLEMMTTCLTRGRPYRLPFDNREFFFDEADFRQLFPARVVNWLIEKGRPARPEEKSEPAQRLFQLPTGADLPVIVAARMSLSFPLLLGAVPLYAIDFSRRDEAQRKLERCWFSDGGICSNFPVHFFDQVLPTRPAFAVNLRPFHPDFPARDFRLARRNNSGRLELWTRFGELGGFFGALLNVLQNWNDNLQIPLPGYRDRILHISMNEAEEGGLNLHMPPPVIQRVAARGAAAAAELLKHYPGVGLTEADQQDPIETTWDNHRWVRYRSTMAQLEALLTELADVTDDPAPDASFAQLAQAPPSYAWDSKAQQTLAAQLTQQLLELAREWRGHGPVFQQDPPNPEPELRVRPRI